MSAPSHRCHTFGIGLDVCVELVTGIAAISGGACVLLAKEERLQTKVRVSVCVCVCVRVCVCVCVCVTMCWVWAETRSANGVFVWA